MDWQISFFRFGCISGGTSTVRGSVNEWYYARISHKYTRAKEVSQLTVIPHPKIQSFSYFLIGDSSELFKSIVSGNSGGSDHQNERTEKRTSHVAAETRTIFVLRRFEQTVSELLNHLLWWMNKQSCSYVLHDFLYSWGLVGHGKLNLLDVQ